MAARVTKTEVKDIIEVDNAVNISPFILAANLMVTDRLGGQGLSAEIMKEIERNIAAHFCCNIDPRAVEETTDEIRVKYAGKFGEGLKASAYGQTALLLDSTGLLSKAGSKRGSFGVVDYSTEL